MEATPWHKDTNYISCGWHRNDSYSAVLSDFRRLPAKCPLPELTCASSRLMRPQMNAGCPGSASRSSRFLEDPVATSARRLHPPPLSVRRPEEEVLDQLEQRAARQRKPARANVTEGVADCAIAEAWAVVDSDGFEGSEGPQGVRDGFFEASFRDEAQLADVLAAAPAPERLRLGDHTWLSEVFFEGLGSLVAGLRELDLRGTRATDAALASIVASSPDLTRLDLSDCGLGNLTPVASLKKLRELRVARCLRAVTAEFMGELGACGCLEILDVSFSPALDNAGLKLFAKRSRSLTQLCVANCPQVSEEGLLLLFGACPNITHFSMAINAESISDEGAARAVRMLRRVKSLDFSGCSQLCRALPIAVARSCEYVEELSFARCGLVDEELRMVLMKCGHLERLDVSGCGLLTDDAFTDGLISGCNLKHVTLNLVGNVTDGRLAELRKRFQDCRFDRLGNKLVEADDLTYVLGPKRVVPIKQAKKKKKKAGGTKKK